MAKINKILVGESLVGEGNEVAHIDLIMGPRGSAAEQAFCHALTNNKDGFTSLLAVVAPNLQCKPNTILFNKVTIKGAKQAVQMFGPAPPGSSSPRRCMTGGSAERIWNASPAGRRGDRNPVLSTSLGCQAANGCATLSFCFTTSAAVGQPFTARWIASLVAL